MKDAVDPRLMAHSLAQELGESEPEPRAQLERIAALLGVERCARLVEQAHCVQEKGGLLCPDGTRPRTFGGVFFWLVRGSITYDEREAIFPKTRRKTGGTATAPPETLEWWHDVQAYATLARTLLAEPGKATTMKMTLIGRPQGISVRTSTVLFVLEEAGAPSLPKGMPPPQGGPLRCMVLVARRQWDKVSAALDDPTDALIIEGHPTMDPRFSAGLTVHATKVTSKALSQQQRTEQRTLASVP